MSITMIDKLYYFKWYVERCIDWDTRVVDVDKWFQTRQRMKVRLKWIDTAEIYGKNASKEWEVAHKYVIDKYQWKEIILRTNKLDKYGRYEWVMYIEEDWKRININEHLVNISLATIPNY